MFLLNKTRFTAVYEIDFVEARRCKMYVMLRSRVFRAGNVLMKGSATALSTTCS